MKNIKRYGMGGAVQSFSSPMLAQGMQGGLSGFGTSGIGMFAKGGKIIDQYDGRTPEDIWNNLSKNQRQHFIYDHLEEIAVYKGIKELPSAEVIKAYNLDWRTLDKDIKNRFANHTRQGQYAKGGQLQIVSRDKGSWYYLRFEGAIGSFQWKYDKRYPEGILYPLDGFDRDITRDIKLKKGEIIFRYETEMMRGRMRPLIKFNLDKSLVYFGVDTEDGEVKFETKGIKLEYILLEEGYEEIYAKGGEVSKSEKLDLLKKELEDNGIYFDLDTDIQKKKYLIVYPIGDNDAFIEHYSFFIDRKGKYEMGFYYIDGEGEKVQTFNDVNEVMNYLKNEKLKTTANKKEESQRIEARKKNYEVVSEIKKKYSIAGNDEEGVWTFSKMIADEIAKKYNGDVQQDGSKWYVSLKKYAKGGQTGFDALSDKVARRYKGKKVDKEYQDEYGKTYDAQEAKEVGDKVAGKVYRQQLAKKGMMAQGGEVEDENQYDFSIRTYKDNLDILNDNPDYEEFRGTKEEVLKKVNDSISKDEIVYAYIWIEGIVTDWYHESGDLERMRMELNRYGENDYAKGGKIVNYKIGDLVLLKYDIRYGRENSIPFKIVDIDDKMLIIEDASKFRSKRRVPRAKVDPSTIIPFENYEKERLSIINTYADGGTIEGRNTSTGEKFAVVIGSQKKADEYIENGTQVNVRKTYSSRISEMKLIFDSEGNLYEEIDYGYALDGYPNTSSGNGYKHGFGKEGLEEKATLRVLSRMYSPSFAKKLIESVKSKNYGEGGKAEVYIENKDVKFDKKKYKGILSDFDLDGLPNVDDPDPFGNQDKSSIEQVKFSNTFNKVLDTKKNLDSELKKFVSKLQKSTSSTEKIYARAKTPFSILNKLVDSRLLDEKRGLKDLVGTTITFENLKDLENYKRKVRRGDMGKVLDYDDYYTNPNDGYRAYHFVIDQDGVPIELQLKTDRMKEVNILSHDAYKNKNLNKDYMLYLTNLADEADKGDELSKERFLVEMSNKARIRKMLSTKN